MFLINLLTLVDSHVLSGLRGRIVSSCQPVVQNMLTTWDKDNLLTTAFTNCDSYPKIVMSTVLCRLWCLALLWLIQMNSECSCRTEEQEMKIGYKLMLCVFLFFSGHYCSTIARATKREREMLWLNV